MQPVKALEERIANKRTPQVLIAASIPHAKHAPKATESVPTPLQVQHPLQSELKGLLDSNKKAIPARARNVSGGSRIAVEGTVQG